MTPLNTPEQQRAHTRRLVAPGRVDNQWAALTTALIRRGWSYADAQAEAERRLARRASIRRLLLIASSFALIALAFLVF